VIRAGMSLYGTAEHPQAGERIRPVCDAYGRSFHKDLEAIDVAAGDIKSVRHEFGWITGIVVVTHVGGEFRFRCYGAKRLAATLAAMFGEIGRHAQA